MTSHYLLDKDIIRSLTNEHEFITMFDQLCASDELVAGDLIVFFCKAAKENWLSAAEHILNTTSSYDNFIVGWELSLTYITHIEMVDIFLKYIPEDNKNSIDWIMPMIFRSPSHLFDVCLQYALEHCSDVDFGSLGHLAAEHGKIEHLELMIHHFEDKDGAQALVGACLNNRRDVIDYLYREPWVAKIKMAIGPEDFADGAAADLFQQGLDYLEQKKTSARLHQELSDALDDVTATVEQACTSTMGRKM